MAVAISLLSLTLVYRLWNASISVPLVYTDDASGDILFYSMLIKGIIDNGWFLNNALVGAPAGLNLFDFPMAEGLHFLLIRFIAIFGGNWAATMNLYYLATYPLTVITSLFVFRRMRVSTPIAVVGSVLFAFMPYHFQRGEIHLFLAGIYIIPLSCLMILRIGIGLPPFIRHDDKGESYEFRSLRTLGYVIIAALTASAGIYYAFFACFFLFVAGIYESFTLRSVKRLVVTFIAITMIAIGVFINIAPSFFYMQKNGRNPEVARRSPNETASYALTIIPMILPDPDHRIDLFESTVTRANNGSPSVPWSASLGMFGASGMLFLLGWLILAKGREINVKKRFYSMIDLLSVLNISAVLLAVVGGFGFFLALVISPQIRAYNRIGIFIGFFSILAVLLVLDILRSKYVRTNIRSAVFFGSLFIVLVGGVLDQTNNQFVPNYDLSSEAFARDEAFIERIESVLPDSGMVFQLPYLPFPESQELNNMNDYNHLRGYLHSNTLRWSYPAMRGREGDHWIKRVSDLPSNQMLKELAGAGFQGVYINRDGYPDGGVEIERQIAEELRVVPIVNEDNTLVFYDMTYYTATDS